MKRKILWMGLSFLLVAALVLGSCAEAVPGEQEEEEEEEEEETLLFAYVTAGDLANPFLATVTRGFIDAVEAFGADSTVGLGDYDYAKTIDLVDAAIAAEVDGIFIFSWFDPVGLVPSVQRALDEGIHVVTMSVRYPFTEAEVPFIGVDYIAQGHEIGLHMAEQLKTKELVSDVHVAVFGESISSPLAIDRKTGFLNGLTDGGIEYTSEFFESTNDFAKSLDIIKAYLIAHPETDVIMGTGSVPTPTGFMALQELGYEPGEILWTGVDIMPEIEVGIRAGYGATNVDEIWSYGFLGAMVLYMRAKYGATVGNLPVYTAMVDADNIDKFLWLLEP